MTLDPEPTKIFLYCVPYVWGGGRHEDVIGYAITADGIGLASHLSSNTEWAKHDLGLTSNWKHDLYNEHCQNGFELEWVDDVFSHPELMQAIAINHANCGTSGDD
jgi:hypothetical protein